jgi:predicted DNA-binding protein
MPTSANVRKLTLNVSPLVGDRLDALARAKGITVTEYLRRAIATQAIIDKAMAEYGDLTIIRKDTNDTVTQLSELL